MSNRPGWPDGYRLIVRETCDSTNAEAARLAGGLDRPTWILAREQTAGRGRRGASWVMPPGNFAATLLMRPGGTAGWSGLRTFMIANALFETLALYVSRARLSLKWPNDVLLDNGKIAGILLESASTRTQVDWLAIGVGVNLRSAPKATSDAAFPPVSLERSDIEIFDFLTRLAGFYATEEEILTRLGFQPIREKWLRDAARLGEIITARTAREEIIGRFETLDEDGCLVLSTPAGERRIAAADIYF